MSNFFGIENRFKSKESRYASTGRLLSAILAVTVGSILLMALMGLVLGWRTGIQFSNGFFIYGSLLILFGVISVLGTFSARGTFEIIYSQSISDMNLFERTKRWQEDINQGFNFVIVFLIPGVLLIGFGILIDKILA